MQTRLFIILLFTVLLSACGSGSGGSSKTGKSSAPTGETSGGENIEAVTPNDSSVVDIDSDAIQGDKIDFQTLLSHSFIFIKLKNITSEDLSINYEIENGAHFDFAGGSAPGTLGNCTNMLSANQECILHIQFTASSNGDYQDRLLLEYNGNKYFFAMSASKTSLLNGLNVELKALTQTSVLDLSAPLLFYRDTYIIVQNLGTQNASIDVQIKNVLSLKYKNGAFPGEGGTCSHVLAAGEECVLVLSSKLSLLDSLLQTNLNLIVNPI